jgi:hypothetical protein
MTMCVQIWSWARREKGKSEVSVVSWLGYDFWFGNFWHGGDEGMRGEVLGGDMGGQVNILETF